jgi:AcrR family transcriptional regulator
VAVEQPTELRRKLLDAAADEISRVGPSQMSMRKVASRVGVTHPALAYHFGDKTGLLTAIAAEGHRRLYAAMAAARSAGGDLLAAGSAYVRFACEDPGWFDVMFRPELLQLDEPELVEAQTSSFAALVTAAGGNEDLAIAAWSLVHGVVSLALAGNLGTQNVDEIDALFRRVAGSFASAPAPAHPRGAPG